MAGHDINVVTVGNCGLAPELIVRRMIAPFESLG